MKFNAGNAGRKWPCSGLSRDQWAVVILAVLLIPAAALAEINIPLPQPRPAAAPAFDRADDKQAGQGTPVPTEVPPAPTACRLALTDAVAIAPSIPPITGPGVCGGDDLVRLEAVVLPDGGRVSVKPAATLRCTMASAIADWIRTDMVPLAEGLGSRVSELDNFDSFECRGRNRVAGAKLSEHGRANALDVRAVKLANGRTIDLTDRAVERDLREKALASVCARFTTVLGPGSDGYHENHIHLDLIQRRNGYRICHWEIYDPMPAVAPLLPAERPAEASPREIVADHRPEATTPPAPPPAAAPPEKPATSAKPETAPFPGSKSTSQASGSAAPPSTAVQPAKVTLPRPRPKDRVVASSSGAASKPAKRKPRRRHSDLPPFLQQLFR
ncbi:MAG: extensin family protein [Nitrobacter sp.]